jgi:hypothetical protein
VPREAFWHSGRTNVNGEYLGRIIENLELSRAYVTRKLLKKLNTTKRDENMIIKTLDSKRRACENDILAQTFKDALNGLSPKELSLVLSSTTFHEHFGKVSHLGDEAIDVLNKES